jgi:glycosyltransferase involved in cell wall biosynthesis
MRILFVINGLVYGGAETRVIALSRALAERGHSVSIYTLSDNNPREAELAGSSVRLIADRKQGKFDPALVARLRKKIREFAPDIVHGFLLEGNLYARLAAANTRVPALNSERNDNYHIPLRHRFALALTRRMAAGVVANTYAGAKFAQRLFHLPSEHVHVVWNGIDPARRDCPRSNRLVDPRTEFFAAAPVLKVATLVGMFRPQKDHVLALEVAGALVQQDQRWRVLFVGDALPHTRRYKEYVCRVRDEMQLGEVVKIAGVRQDVDDIIKQSNVLLSTSLHEGFPNVVIESMAVGTPVVSTDYSDIKLILPNDWQVVSGRNASAIAAAVIKADSERSQVAKQQSAWLHSNATLNQEVERLEAVYRKYIAA